MAIATAIRPKQNCPLTSRFPFFLKTVDSCDSAVFGVIGAVLQQFNMLSNISS